AVVPAMSYGGPAVSHGNEAEREDERPADTLYRLPYAGDRQYRRRCRRLRQDDQNTSLCQRAGGREQRLLGRPPQVACLRCTQENKYRRRRRPTRQGDAHSIHGRLRHLPCCERIAFQIEVAASAARVVSLVL